ncbi:MAG TPA: hypothetical protein PLO88_03445, partial [Bacilli bacterium]|nr:hypothetical protein [Bacilli bacterium]
PNKGYFNEEFAAYKKEFVAFMFRDEANNPWDFIVQMEHYQPTFPMDFINPEKFEKREGVNIYDYPLSQKELKIIIQNMEMGDDLTVKSALCHLDLDAYKLVVTLETEELRADDVKEITNVVAEFILSDPGQTIFEIPIADAKLSVLALVDEEVANREEINFAKPESITAFNAYVDTVKTKINSADSLITLIGLVNTLIPNIATFQFEVDAFAQDKFNRIAEMTNYFEGKVLTATADSIVAMTAIYNTDVANMKSTINITQMENVFDAYFGRINDAFVFDELKIVLNREKTYHLNWLSVSFGQMLNPYLSSTKDQERLNDTIHQYSTAIESATTVEEISTLYNQAIEALKTLSLSWQDRVTELPQRLIQNLDYLIDFVRPFVGENEDFEAQVLALADSINAQNDPVKMVEAYINSSKQLNIIVKQIAIDRLTAKKEQLAPIITDNDYNHLILIYNEALEIINDAPNVVIIMNIVQHFEAEAEDFQIDPVKESIIFRVDLYTRLLASRVRVATADSIVAMQAIFDEHIPLIKASTTIEQLGERYNTAYRALVGAFVQDPDKQLLWTTIYEVQLKMVNLTDYLGNLLSATIMDQVQDLYNEYIEKLNNALTLSEVDPLYNEWYTKLQLLDLTAGVYPLNEMKATILQNGDNIRQIIISFVKPLPENFVTDYVAFETFVQ